MMKAGILIAAATAIAAPAAASTGSGDADRVYDLGRCIVKQDREVAAQLLQDLPLGQREVELNASTLAEAGECLKGQTVSASSSLVRGALAQALLLKDFPRFGVQPKIATDMFAKIDLPLQGTSADVDERTASVYKLADCVVRNQAIKTESLFRSPPGSDLEGRVLDAIAPYIAACSGNSAEMRISRPEFRSAMAQAAYSVSARYWTGDLSSAK